MANKQKGFGLGAVIAIIAVIIVGSVSYYMFTRTPGQVVSTAPHNNPVSIQPVSSPVVISTNPSVSMITPTNPLDLQKYLADKVFVILESSECCGLVNKDSATQNLKDWATSGGFTWNQNDSEVVKIKSQSGDVPLEPNTKVKMSDLVFGHDDKWLIGYHLSSANKIDYLYFSGLDLRSYTGTNQDCAILARQVQLPQDGYKINLSTPLICTFNIGHNQKLTFRFTDNSVNNKGIVGILVTGQSGQVTQSFVIDSFPIASYVMYPYFFSIKDDANFDGYKDILVTSWVGASMSRGGWWMFDPRTSKFVQDVVVGNIDGPYLDTSNKVVTGYTHGSACAGTSKIYKFNGQAYQLTKSLETECSSPDWHLATCLITLYNNGVQVGQTTQPKACFNQDSSLGVYQSIQAAE